MWRRVCRCVGALVRVGLDVDALTQSLHHVSNFFLPVCVCCFVLKIGYGFWFLLN